MRLVRPLAMTNANIPRKIKNYIEEKTSINIKINYEKYMYNLWLKIDKFLSFLNSFLKRANDLKLLGKAFHALEEGLNGVNRQPSNGQKINRQPSKTEYFYRQPSNERAKISRQISQISFNDQERLT